MSGCGGSGETQVPFNPTPDTPVSTPASVVPSSEHLSIPSIGVDVDMIPLGLTAEGEHEVPPVEKSEIAGWFEPGPEPGEVGPSIILGHINGGGKPGVFAKLGSVKVGDKINAGGHQFTVYSVKTTPKDAFPAKEVYSETKAPELRLITCGGAFDSGTGHYMNNEIVYAA